jgi:histidine triad (HIT) family protein
VAECQVCEKHRGEGPLVGELLYEDATVLAYHAPVDLVRGYLGYCFVETRRHARGLADLSDAETQAVAATVSRVARALEVEGAENVYSFVFNHIPHHHVHVVARYPGTPREYQGTRIDEWPDAPRGDAAEVAALSARLRAALG